MFQSGLLCLTRVSRVLAFLGYTQVRTVFAELVAYHVVTQKLPLLR